MAASKGGHDVEGGFKKSSNRSPDYITDWSVLDVSGAVLVPLIAATEAVHRRAWVEPHRHYRPRETSNGRQRERSSRRVRADGLHLTR
jgi:hypothetical protein